MTHHAPGRRRGQVGRAAAASSAALLLTASAAVAQQRLIDLRTSSAGVVVDGWSFGDGLRQRLVLGDSVHITRAGLVSVPIAVTVPVGEYLSLDVSGVYAAGAAEYRRAGETATHALILNGPGDVRLRGTVRFPGDYVLFTAGMNAPTGIASLDRQQLEALRVLAAPALGFGTAPVTQGVGASAGLVLARQIGDWALAFGTSYEFRGSYSPIAAIQAGLPTTDYNPGEALHFTVGADGLFGQSAMTLSASADFFTTDELTANGAGVGSVRLGPAFGAQWQLSIGAPAFRELVLSVVDRWRSTYARNGSTVAGTSGNYFDATLRSALPIARGADLIAALVFRHQTGLDATRTIATARALLGGVTFGLGLHAGDVVVNPFVRGQLGSIDAGTGSVGARGAAAGLLVSRQF